MAITYQSITDRAFRIANGIGIDAHDSPTIDGSFLTEDLFIAAMRQAVSEANFKRTFTLALTNGVAALSDDVILEKLNTATIVNSDDDTPTSFETRFFDFARAPSDLINYACADGRRFYYREAKTDADDFDGSIQLTAVALPAIPASVTDAIDIPITLADRTSEILADLIRGN